MANSKKPKKPFVPLKIKAKQPTENIAQPEPESEEPETPTFETHYNLGIAFYHEGHIARAREHFLQASILNPQSTETKHNLAVAIHDDGDFESAEQVFEQVIALNSDIFRPDLVFSEMIYLLHFRPVFERDHQMALLQRYHQLFAHVPQTQLPQRGQPHKPLRVGFVSSDLREHPVGHFLESTLAELRRDPALSSQLILTAYYNAAIQDDYTYRLNEQFDGWYRVDSWSDDRLADQIKRDQIDILFDLGGHTIGNRLPVFARKVAPLQVSWLGYWGSTGLPTIDYLLADPISIPVDEENWFVEKIWRLPHLRYCFSLPEDAPDITPPPCLQRQEFVFGCYQNLQKLNDRVLQCWARILTACPHARLRIQGYQLDNALRKDRFILKLQAARINIEQVDIIGFMPRKLYMASYAEVDILLDSFPYPGGTTTAEALWMGVPTITLASQGMIAHQGEALMSNAGLADWVTYREEDYISKAILWANADASQRLQLAALRSEMREKVRQSPVFNAQQFAQDFMTAVYGMWQEKYGA